MDPNRPTLHRLGPLLDAIVEGAREAEKKRHPAVCVVGADAQMQMHDVTYEPKQGELASLSDEALAHALQAMRLRDGE